MDRKYHIFKRIEKVIYYKHFWPLFLGIFILLVFTNLYISYQIWQNFSHALHRITRVTTPQETQSKAPAFPVPLPASPEEFPPPFTDTEPQSTHNPLQSEDVVPLFPPAITQASAPEIPWPGLQMTFGSQTILQQLWTPQELQGTPQDAAITRQRLHAPLSPAGDVLSLTYPPLGARSPYAIRWVHPVQHRKVVALTFDLCERADEVAGYDASIVNALRREHVHATFFVGGKWMYTHPEKAMQLIADPLFEIGNHGWTHRNLRVLKGAILEQEILWTQTQYARLQEEIVSRAHQHGIAHQEIAKIPPRPLIMRFPYGTCSPEALQHLTAHGLQAIQWDVVSGDPARGQTSDNIVATVLRRTQPGSIVIFHANGRSYGTAAALPRLIQALIARGYTFLTVSELLQGAEDVVAPAECYELHPGDNQRYDTLVRERDE